MKEKGVQRESQHRTRRVKTGWTDSKYGKGRRRRCRMIRCISHVVESEWKNWNRASGVLCDRNKELEYRGKCVQDSGKISATGQRMRHIKWNWRSLKCECYDLYIVRSYNARQYEKWMNQGGRKWGKSEGSSVKEVEVRCEERKPCRVLGDGDGSTIRMDSEGLH